MSHKRGPSIPSLPTSRVLLDLSLFTLLRGQRTQLLLQRLRLRRRGAQEVPHPDPPGGERPRPLRRHGEGAEGHDAGTHAAAQQGRPAAGRGGFLCCVFFSGRLKPDVSYFTQNIEI